MSDSQGVVFQEDDEFSRRASAPAALRPKRSPWSPMGLVLRTGIVRTEQGANAILLILAVLMFVSAAGIYVWDTPQSRTPGLPPDEQDASLHAMGAVGY